MNINELNRQQARSAMDDWKIHPDVMPYIDGEWQTLRTALQNRYSQLIENTNIENYDLDVEMGLYLYEYFRNSGFTMRMASNDGLWRYIALKVIPDLVGKRWGNDAEDHYWVRPSRIWPCSIWWYVHLSWQGSESETREVLRSPNFTTDTILNLEERTGRNGTYIDVYRYIMYFYSTIEPSALSQINAELKKSDKNATLFRTIMKLNTARAMTVEPSLCMGGAKQYVISLFREVSVDMAE